MNTDKNNDLLVGTATASSEVLANNDKYALDLTNKGIAEFGNKIQSEVGDLTNEITSTVKNKNAGEAGDTILGLMKILRDNDPSKIKSASKGNWLMNLFNKGKEQVYDLQVKNETASQSIDKAKGDIINYQQQLASNNNLIDKLYEKNKQQFRDLNNLVVVGNDNIEKLDIQINELQSQKDRSTEDDLKLRELEQMKTRLSRKVNNLLASRQLALQRAPKLQMIQENNDNTIEQLQSSVNFAIPVWKQQVADAILVEQQRQGMAIQKFVTEQTNAMITRGAEDMKKATLEASSQNEQSFISAESLKQATETLKDTLIQVRKLQQQGDEFRKQESQNLLNSGNEMRQVALELMQDSKEDPLKIEGSSDEQ
ncbi:tellurite resistance protein [Lactobacillus phage LpeD]|uniref:Tellurite resistance protein n=1 Tax=Lactobacillus phage LpeD TaxID=2041210 RepID=A0A291I9K4_9CAUD|nr:tellurite resistance [Lactobacillus phage LpeD]ATG86376.1 tellurite resistance protein [Lactobacillus phage LpeD]